MLLSLCNQSTPQEVKGIIEEYDVDGNDSLDFSEFLMLTAKLDPRIGQEIEINKAFKLFDKDNDGFITRCVEELVILIVILKY